MCPHWPEEGRGSYGEECGWPLGVENDPWPTAGTMVGPQPYNGKLLGSAHKIEFRGRFSPEPPKGFNLTITFVLAL